MRTIAVVSRKGGAGKTTLAVNLAVAAQQVGLKAIVADIDPLRSAAVALARRTDVQGLLLETTGSKLRAVRDAARRQGCRLLVIDTPPFPDGEVARAVDVADFCLAVARPSSLDLAALDETLKLITKHKKKGLVVLNQCPPARTGVEAAIVRRAVASLEFSRIPVSQTKVRSRIAYQHALNANLGVAELAPSSEAALELQRLLVEAGEIMFEPARPKSHLENRSFVQAPSEVIVFDEPWGTSPIGLVSGSAGEFWKVFG